MARKRLELTKNDVQQIAIGLAEIEAIYSRRIMPLMNRFRIPIQDKIRKRFDASKIAYDIENDVADKLGEHEGMGVLYTYRNALKGHIEKLPLNQYKDFPLESVVE